MVAQDGLGLVVRSGCRSKTCLSHHCDEKMSRGITGLLSYLTQIDLHIKIMARKAAYRIQSKNLWINIEGFWLVAEELANAPLALYLVKPNPFVRIPCGYACQSVVLWAQEEMGKA